MAPPECAKGLQGIGGCEVSSAALTLPGVLHGPYPAFQDLEGFLETSFEFCIANIQDRHTYASQKLIPLTLPLIDCGLISGVWLGRLLLARPDAPLAFPVRLATEVEQAAQRFHRPARRGDGPCSPFAVDDGIAG